MKIRSVRAFPVQLKPAKPYQLGDRQPAGPLERCPAYRGVALADTNLVPGAAIIEDGCLVPSDAPGFGIDVDLEWLERAAV